MHFFVPQASAETGLGDEQQYYHGAVGKVCGNTQITQIYSFTAACGFNAT